MSAVRLIAAILGGVMALGTSASVLQTLVTPGGQVGRLFRLVDQLTDKLFLALTKRVAHYERRARILAYQAPLALAVALGSWLIAYWLSFALLLWPSTRSLAAAFRESGSSLLTLGFASTRAGEPTVVDFLAGATGLIVVALQIAYLPTLYSAFNRRETEVTLIGV